VIITPLVRLLTVSGSKKNDSALLPPCIAHHATYGRSTTACTANKQWRLVSCFQEPLQKAYVRDFCHSRQGIMRVLFVRVWLVSELTTDVNIFVDPVSTRQALANKRYFRYLSLDANDRRYLYAGAMYVNILHFSLKLRLPVSSFTRGVASPNQPRDTAGCRRASSWPSK